MADALAFTLPRGSTDAHSHVVGDPVRWPQIPDKRYEPEVGPAEAYRDALAELGLDRCVLVQPSIYGTDNGCQLEAMALIGPARCRGIAVVAEDVSDAELRRLHDAGMRGIRFNLKSGGLGLGALAPITRRIAPLGWHAQIFTSADVLAEAAPQLRQLPVPVVIDHMGGPKVAEGLAQSGFQAVLGLLKDGKGWVKISGAERLSQQDAEYDDVVPFAQALIAAAPERVVWGMDWPPSRFFKKKPPLSHFLHQLNKYTADAERLRMILVDNPARLYGF